MNWPENFFFSVDDFGRKWSEAVIFGERDVILSMPIHGNEDLIEEWGGLDSVDGIENLTGIRHSKGASFTEVVLRINDD